MRYIRKFLEARFRFAAEAMGWDTKGPYRGDRNKDGFQIAHVGAVFLEKAPVTGWRISQICNERGGERKISDTLSAAELVAFLDGILYAKEFWQPIRLEGKAS